LNAKNLLQLDRERLSFIYLSCNAQTYQPITNQLTNNLLRYPNVPPGFTQTTNSPSTGFAAAIPPISVAPQVNSYMQPRWIPNPAAPPPPSMTALQMNPYGQQGWAPNPAATAPPPTTALQVDPYRRPGWAQVSSSSATTSGDCTSGESQHAAKLGTKPSTNNTTLNNSTNATSFNYTTKQSLRKGFQQWQRSKHSAKVHRQPKHGLKCSATSAKPLSK
jgi:hypothetical protein